ncbi:MAG TPA: SH3 domain-containing protein, partial [Aggregatilineales bacterium]|nr:SH3 domain-containing protein [Aggregatilineales bacterium]
MYVKNVLQMDSYQKNVFRFVLIVCVWVATFSLFDAATAHAQDACIDLVTPRLGAEVTARAAFNDGVGVVFRDAPGTIAGQSNVLDTLSEGVIMTVIGVEPACKDGFLWWQVRLPDGREGYVAEGAGKNGGYFLEPWEVGADIFRPGAGNPNQIDHFFVDTRGNVQQRAPLGIISITGTVAEIWQSSEITVADV